MLASQAAIIPDYPVRDAAQYDIHVQQGGIAIGAQPVDSLKEQRTYFRAELADLYSGANVSGQKKGRLLPVFIVMQNQSAAQSFLFDVKTLTYEVPDIDNGRPGVRAVLLMQEHGSLLGALTFRRGISYNPSEIRQNMLKKELRSATLSPGGAAHGFLYVPLPKEGARVSLRFPVNRSGSTDTLVLELGFTAQKVVR